MKPKFILFLLIISGLFMKVYGQYPPANDNCQNAITVELSSAGYACTIGTNTNATSEGITNACDLAPAGSEIWYKYVVVGDSNTITVTPLGVSPMSDAVITVYSGDCNSLTQISCNSGSGSNPVVITETLTIGTHIWIAVESNGTNGDFELCVQSDAGVIPGNTCSEAPQICNFMPFTVTDLSGFTAESYSNTCSMGTIPVRKSSWITFTVTGSGFIEFIITPLSGSDEYDWALYDITAGCFPGPGNPNPNSCNTYYSTLTCGISGAPTGAGSGVGQPCPGEFTTTFVSSGVSGRTYALLIDNNSQTNNGYSFEWGAGTTAEISARPKISLSVSESCSIPVTVNVTNSSVGTPTNSVWDFGDGTSGTGTMPSSHTYTTHGDYAVSLTYESSNGCTNASAQRVNLNTGPIISLSAKDTLLCANDSIQINATVSLGSPTNSVRFSNTTVTAIPNNSVAGANPTINVSGISPATMTTGMVENVCFTIRHGRLEDITEVNLTSPDNVTYTFTPVPLSGTPNTNVEFCFPSSVLNTISGNINGVWTLHVRDKVNKTGGIIHTGFVMNWYMDVADANSLTYAWTPNDATINDTTLLNPTVFPAVTSTYTLSATDNNACTTTAATDIQVWPRPGATISGGGSACFGDSLPVNIAFTGTAPYYFTLLDAFGSTLMLSAMSDTTFYVDSTNSYSIISISDSACSGNGTGSASIYINTAIQVNVLDTVCNLAATKYVIRFEITGGDTNTYSITGSTGTLIPGNPYIFVSDSISSSSTYIFFVKDAINCNSQTVSGSYTCECAAGANITGAIDTIICQGDSVPVSVDIVGNGPWTMSYTDGTSTFNVAPSASPFVFQAKTNGTYKITSVTDQYCSDIGTDSARVTVKNLPTASITNTGAMDTICPTDSANICIALTGEAPFSFTYLENIGMNSSPVAGYNSNSLCFYENQNAAYTITAISDNFCVGTIPLDTAKVFVINAVSTSNVNIVNNLKATKYVVSFEVNNGDTATYNVAGNTGSITLGSPNIFTSDSILCGSGPYSFTVTDNVGCTPDIVTGTYSCVCASGATVSGGDTICYGDSTAITINLTGALPYTVIYRVNGIPDTISNILTPSYTLWAKTNGIYSFDWVDDKNCRNPISQSIPVVVNALPAASLSGSDTLCDDGNAATILVSFTGTSPFDFTLTNWTTMDSMVYSVSGPTFSFDTSVTGMYGIKRLSDSTGCSATDVGIPQSVKMVEPDTADINYALAGYCEGFGSIFPIVSPNTNTGGIYSVYPTSITINSTTGELDLNSGISDTTYVVTYTSPSPLCSTTSMDTLKIISYDDATFGYQDSEFCPEGTTAPVYGLNTVLGGTFASIPSTLVVNPSTGVVTLNSGIVDSTYLITYTTPVGGCQTTDTFTVAFQFSDNASFSFLPDSIFCQLDSVAPTLHPAAKPGGTFSASSGGLIIDPVSGMIDLDSSSVNTYTVYYTTPFSVCQSVDSSVITIIGAPPSIDTTVFFCEASLGLGLSVPVIVISDYEYLVNGGNDSLNLTWYQKDSLDTLVEVTTFKRSFEDGEVFYINLDADGQCSTQATLTVQVNPQADAGKNSPGIRITPTPGTINLYGFLADSIFTGGFWLNANGDSIPDGIIDPYFAEGRFKYVVVPDAPCKNDTSFHTFILLDDGLYVPSAFTPNSDGVNDYWEIGGLTQFYQNANVRIFNRWGEMVYESGGIDGGLYIAWNGKRGAKQLPAATYYYVIDLNDPTNTENLKGTVTIMR